MELYQEFFTPGENLLPTVMLLAMSCVGWHLGIPPAPACIWAWQCLRAVACTLLVSMLYLWVSLCLSTSSWKYILHYRFVLFTARYHDAGIAQIALIC